MYTQPNLTTTTSLDFAESHPSTMVRAGNIDKTASPTSTGRILDGRGRQLVPGQQRAGRA